MKNMTTTCNQDSNPRREKQLERLCCAIKPYEYLLPDEIKIIRDQEVNYKTATFIKWAEKSLDWSQTSTLISLLEAGEERFIVSYLILKGFKTTKNV